MFVMGEKDGKKIRCVKEFKVKANLKEHINKGTRHSATIKDPKMKDPSEPKEKAPREEIRCMFIIGTDQNGEPTYCNRVFNYRY
jgi:hypothetical protein